MGKILDLLFPKKRDDHIDQLLQKVENIKLLYVEDRRDIHRIKKLILWQETANHIDWYEWAYRDGNIYKRI